MKRLGLKIIGVFIITIVIIQNSMLLAASAEEEKLKNQQNEIKKEEEESKDKLKEVQAKKSETVKQVEELSNEIADYEAQIDELEGQIEGLNTKIAESEQKLKKAQEDYTKQEKLLEDRLVATYEAGETSYLDFLLSSQSITDFISNYYLVTEVANNDTELLEKIQKQKEEITQAKNELEISKQELATSKASKQSVSTQLQTAKKAKNQQVAKLTDEEKEIQAQIQELRDASTKIEKEIKLAQERYQQQIDNLDKGQGNSSNNNGGTGNSGSTAGKGFLRKPLNTGVITATMYYSDGSYHGAIDYGVPIGTPVFAAADGVVVHTENLTYSYGTHVVIQHANGLQTWYGHGTKGSICVSEGQTVSKGQLIMKSGNTGRSSGPHLHFEVRVSPYNYNTCRVDPRNYM